MSFSSVSLIILMILLAFSVHASPYSPFNKKVFDPGWKGDFLYADSDKKVRGVVTNSFDFEKTETEKLLLNLRMYDHGKHCVGELIESSRSSDGMTLFLKPSSDNSCKSGISKVSISVVEAKKLRVELQGKNEVLGVSTLWPHNAQTSLQLTAAESEMIKKRQIVTATTAPSGTKMGQATQEAVSISQKEPVKIPHIKLSIPPPSKEMQKKIDASRKAIDSRSERRTVDTSKIPTTLAGLYFIGKQGDVSSFKGKNNLLYMHTVLANKLGAEMGDKPGSYIGKATYDSHTGTFKYWTKMYSPQNSSNKLRHCGDLFTWPRKFKLRPLSIKDGTTAQGKWEAIPIESNYCDIHAINPRTCKIAKCSKYKTLQKGQFMASKTDSVEIGKALQLVSDEKSLAEKERELKYLDQQSKGKSSNPSYWEAGGDCGSRSCYEQTIDDTNQFLIDNYW